MKKMISFIVTAALLLSALAGVGLPAKEVKAATNKVLTTAIQASESTTTNTYELDADTAALTIPVSIQKAGIMEFKVTFQGFSELARISLQRKQESSSSWNDMFSWIQHSATKEFTDEYATTEPINCYLVLTTTGADQNKTGSVTVTTTFREATTGREVKPGETVNATQIKEKEYYKIKLTTHKKVTINGTETSFTLCDATKKYISSCDKTMYLNKGTYYLCHDGEGTYQFSYNVKKITLPKNTSRKKAKKMKLKKIIKGIFTRNGNSQKSYWYKLTLKKNKKIKVKYKNKVGEFVSVTLLNAKGELQNYMNLEGKKGTKKMISYGGKKPAATIRKGTYYIEIGNAIGVDSEFSVTFK